MKRTGIILGTALVGSLLAVGIAFAATPAQGARNWNGMGGGARGMVPGVFGTVSAVSGDTLTVTSSGFGRNATSTPVTTYTVNAAGATIVKNGATSTVSAIAVGDRVMVRGTVSGTSVTATAVNDGVMPGQGMGRNKGDATSTRPMSPIQGNGEPVIGGTISAMSGATLTVTNKSSVTYTVDASNAKIVKGNATSTLASVAVNDNVVIQGAVNGNSVVATSIIDSGAPQSQTANNGAPANKGGFMGGIFNGIGSFFQHLFGF